MADLLGMFEESCRRWPQKALFEVPGGAGLSYGDALDRTRRLARVLGELGVAPGERVMVQVEKSPEAVLLYLACLQTGAVYLPLNTAYTAAEVDYFVGDAEPALFVCRPTDAESLRARHGGRLAVETLDEHGEGSLATRMAAASPLAAGRSSQPGEPAAILYTSGTTGRSKGAVLTRANLASNTEALVAAWNFSAADRLIHALPIFHTHGLFVACNMSIATGATMIFLSRFDTEQVIGLMGQATVLMGVPTFYTRLLQSPGLTPEAVASMRLFVSGSAPLTAETSRAFTRRTGHAILERYGMTETCMITSNPLEGERRPGTVGFPLPGIEVRISGQAAADPVPAGEIGMIEVRGPNVFQGYWRMPEKTRAEFTDDGFFRTGDLGLFDADGYLNIVGRDKDLVISGGYNIYPKEVETLLDAVEGVAESAVIGLPHPDMGEAVVAVIVPSGAEPIKEDRIIEGLRLHLARFKVPRKIFVVDHLPRNAMGKVQKNELRARYGECFQQETDSV